MGQHISQVPLVVAVPNPEGYGPLEGVSPSRGGGVPLVPLGSVRVVDDVGQAPIGIVDEDEVSCTREQRYE